MVYNSDMLTLIIKLTLLLMGLLGLHIFEDLGIIAVIALLVVITITSLNQYFGRRAFTMAACGLYGVVCLFVPIFSMLLPLLVFDLARYSKIFAAVLGVPLIIYNPLLAPIIAAAILFEHLRGVGEDASQRYTLLMDSHTEQKRALVQKTKELTKNQDEAAHVAKLSERNRIARDIHDNIGHVLSRAILQTGALQALNKDKNLEEPLKSLKETLINSMESIRGSVHDLKDDSIDLFQAIQKVFEDTRYEVNLHYDLAEDVPNHVKYCFLMAAKEALTNTMKHSDATEIKVTVREHPALYQLRIQDNGTRKPNDTGMGMGLQNIADRVKGAGGHCTFEYEDGFRIFITLPKGDER
jgi:signal transduction histidine kinase